MKSPDIAFAYEQSTEQYLGKGYVTKIPQQERPISKWYLPHFPILRPKIRQRWLVGWFFGLNGPLIQYFSLYRVVSQREGERGEKRIDESKNVQTTPDRTYYKRSRPLPYCNPNCRTPRHWKFTQHHRTTRPPPTTKTRAVFDASAKYEGTVELQWLEHSWLVHHGCFELVLESLGKNPIAADLG